MNMISTAADLYKNVCTLQTIPTSVFDFEQ